jgi:transposase
MDAPILTPEVLASLPPEIVACLRWCFAEIDRQRTRIAELETQVATLQARLDQNSSNSSKPPSSDPPHYKPAPKNKPSGRRPGGQPGHPRHVRPQRPPTEVVNIIPDTCTQCGRLLLGHDASPLCRQVVELPEIRPQVTEYRLHRLTCLCCGAQTRAPTPAEAAHEYGARFQATTALLSGECRLGKRTIAGLCQGLFGIDISIGQVCALEQETSAVVQPIVEEAQKYVQTQPVNVDETGWKERKQKTWLWVAATRLVAVFAILGSRSRASFRSLMGPAPPDIVTSDRYSAYSHLPAERRQLCWAHLRRDFQAMIDRNTAGRAIGEALLEQANTILAEWKPVRAGTRNRAAFQSDLLPALRQAFEATLQRGVGCGCAKTSGVCMELLRWKESLWTFAAHPGVEPTNNAAERAVRHAVCWRKTSYGTASAAGSRFAERLLTIVASCRLQGRKALDFLTSSLQSARNGAWFIPG